MDLAKMVKSPDLNKDFILLIFIGVLLLIFMLEI